MLKKIIYTLLILNIFSLPGFAQVIDISSARDNPRIKPPMAEIYKPSRLLIGDKTEFTVKGDPGTYVIIVFSAENEGAKPYYGQHLRLGNIIDKIEGVIGEKGIAKLDLEIPEREDLVGAIIYFEALVWKTDDLSDVKKARIMGASGIETSYNAISIEKKPEKHSLPLIGPGIGGMGDVSRTMEALSSQKSSEKDYLYNDDMYYHNKPLMLRNLRSPDIKKEQKINE